ncbi:MAG TPA: acyl-CoA thioesterase [Planctomycetaceae bacterium]|nr:acyl-CoA thioesterase [Planctomycetaceae bacterium]
MPAIFLFPHAVADDEIDELGHVSNLAYLKWMQEAAVAHSTAQGWPLERYLHTGGGWVARSHWIEYLRPAFVDEQIVVQTWVANFKKITSLRKYRILRPADRTVLAVARTDWAYIGLKNRVPRRIPPELAESFEVVPEEREPGDDDFPDGLA